jgi:spermidine synthase
MQPMSLIVFLSSLAFYPLFSSLYYYLLINTGKFHLAIAQILCTFGAGLYFGAWFSKRYEQSANKKFLTFLSTTFIFGSALLLFFKLQSNNISQQHLFLFAGILFFIYGTSCSLLLSFVRDWQFYTFWGLLIGIFWKENFLIDVFGYPGILLTISILYLFISLFLWLFRKHQGPYESFDMSPHTPEWRPSFWFFITIFVQCVTLWFFWNTERLTATGLNDTEFTHTIFLLTAVFNLGIGAQYGHYLNNGKRDQQAVYRNLILFGIVLFLVLANNKSLLSLPQLFTYNDSIRSQHAYVLINLASAFLITLPMAPAGQLFYMLYQIGFYRFISALFISLVIGSVLYFGIILPYLGITNSFFYSIYLVFTVGIILYCKIEGTHTSRYYTVLYLFLSILVINHIYKNPVFLNHTSTVTAMEEQNNGYKIDNLEPQMSLDGPIDSVRFLQDSETNTYYLVGNGQVVANWNPKKATRHEVVAVLTPFLAAAHTENPKQALVMGLKEGLVTQVLLEIPSISSVETIENETSYIQIASQANYYPELFSNPASNIRAEDYRFYLQHSEKLFDLILLNTDAYWKRYESKFYTKEFYEMIKNHLNNAGVFSQALNLKSLPPITFNTLIKTISSVFPYNQLYMVTNTDMVIISSTSPIKNQSTSLFSNKKLVKRLKKIDIKTSNDIKARFFAKNDLIKLYTQTFTAGGEHDNLFFDYFPFIESESTQSLKAPSDPSLPILKWGIFPSFDYIYNEKIESPDQITSSPFSDTATNYHNSESIYRYIQNPNQKDLDLPKDILDSLSTLEISDPAYCKDLTERHIWLHAYLHIMEHTLPYLNDDKMKIIVGKMRKHHCNAFYTEPDVVLKWLSLHEALLAHNYTEVLNQAKQVYNKDKNNIGTQIALTYVLLAQVKLKQFPDAVKTWGEFPFKFMAADFSQLLAQYAINHLNTAENAKTPAKAPDLKTSPK